MDSDPEAIRNAVAQHAAQIGQWTQHLGSAFGMLAAVKQPLTTEVWLGTLCCCVYLSPFHSRCCARSAKKDDRQLVLSAIRVLLLQPLRRPDEMSEDCEARPCCA